MNNLKILRKAKGLTQKEVADLLTELKGEQDDLSIKFGEV